MIENKEWLIELGLSKKTSVRLVDFKSMHPKGMRKIVVIQRKDIKDATIENVLFVPSMKRNLMSLGVEKWFLVIMKEEMLQLFDPNHRLVLISS